MDRYENVTIEEMLTLYEVGFVARIENGKVIEIIPAEWEERK